MKQIRKTKFGGIIMSPPARGRGLKLPSHPVNHLAKNVAPRTGAWIETKVS